MRPSWLQPRATYRLRALGVCLVFLVALGILSIWPSAGAADLPQRSITIGTSRADAVTTNVFSFKLSTGGTLGSIQFQYCSNSALLGAPCTPPAGLSVLGAVMTGQTGATGFSIDPLTTSSTLVISRSPAPASAGPVSYSFSNIVNPSQVNHSMFVRITTYTSSDTSGPITDNGSVVFVLTNGIGTTAFVPPRLVLCVGATVSLNCSAQVHDIQSLGVLTPQTTGFTTTQFSVGTNYPGGYNIFVLGNTLTSGNNIIPAIATQQTSIKGTGQFGLNLIANGLPPVGANPAGIGTGLVDSGYNSANHFKFQTGDLVADSPNSTDFSLFTVSYIANVDQAQPEGIYSTTMTYLAVPSF